MSAASSSTPTSCWVMSPRTSTSRAVGSAPASAVKIRPSFSASGIPGRTSSAITPPETLTASGTSSPASARRTERATATPGLLLGLVGGRPEVRRNDDGLELEQRRLGGRLGGEDVDAGTGDPSLLEGDRERVLVDDAAAGRVDDPHRRLDLAQGLVADQPDGLRRLRQVHGDEVADLEQLVEADETHAHLGSPRAGDVGVEGHDLHAERRKPLRDKDTDPAETDDADDLLVELDPGVLAALPLTGLERGIGGRDVAGRGQQQPDRQLGRRDDVGRRGVDHHDAGLRGRRDVDVVQPDAGPGHDLERTGGGQRLGVHLGRRADQDRVDVRDGGQQGGPVSTVAVPDLEVRAESLDRRGRELLGDEHDWSGHQRAAVPSE